MVFAPTAIKVVAVAVANMIVAALVVVGNNFVDISASDSRWSSSPAMR